MARKYRILGPAVAEPGKVYGRAAAAECAGVTKLTIAKWEKGWGPNEDAREATRQLEPEIDYGRINYGLQRYGNRGQAEIMLSNRKNWYRVARLRQLGRLARENELLRRHGCWKQSAADYDDLDERAELVHFLMERDGVTSLDEPLPPKNSLENQTGLLMAASPTVLTFPVSSERQAARALAERLAREEADRERFRAEREQAELARELAAMTPDEQAVIAVLLAPKPPRPSRAGKPKRDPAAPKKAPGRPPLRRLAREEAARIANAQREEKLAAWRARTGYPGPSDPEDLAEAS